MQNSKLLLPLTLSAVFGGAIALTGSHFLSSDKKFSSFEDKQKYYLSNFLSDTSLAANTPGGTNFVAAAEITSPAVVHIKTYFEQKESSQQFNQQLDPFFREFFGDDFGGRLPRNNKPQEASGSGVIISNDGYIVTNNHVIENADKIEVILEDKRSYTAKLIGKDPTTDLALLKVEESSLPFVRLGNSDKVKIGEWVLAVGNPYDLTSTVTAGIVSAKARNINLLRSKENFAVESFIQTDAAVNPGNSGGALVNLRGELIGINTAIASPTGSYSGYSFAVPVNLVKKVMDDLLKFGEVQRGLLGINIQDVNSQLAKEKGLKDIKGVYVAGVTEKGAAKEAGIKEGDVILKVDEQKVNSTAELQEAVAKHRPGDKVNLQILRDGAEKQISAVLKNRVGTTEVVKVTDGKFTEKLGAEFVELTSAEKKKFKIESGVKVTNIKKGILQDVGVKEGFMITSINKTKVKDPNDVLEILETPRKGGVLIEGVYPNGKTDFYAFDN